MAKTKRKTTGLKMRSTASKNQSVSVAVGKLRGFFAMGKEVLKADAKNPRKKAYSPGVIREIAQKIGMAEDYVHKARKFAKTYSASEFKELCSLRRPDGMPLGCRHIIALLRIKDKRQRKKYQNKAIKEGLSVRDLSFEISQDLGIGNDAGRQPKSPTTLDAALMQVIAMTRKWTRWYSGFDPENESGEDRIFLDGLPKEVAMTMKQISGKIDKLQKITTQTREKIQK